MIPIRDRNPSPITPWVVYGLIAINVLIFFGEWQLNDPQLRRFIGQYGLIPAKVTLALEGEANILTALIIPAFSSMFLHGGVVHLLSNMWFLYIFGDNVEAKLRRVPFLLFYLVCGLIAHVTQYVLAPESTIPTVGASGAIAGVLGAYIVTWPRARVVTLVPLFYLFTFMSLPAVFVLGFWFVLQLFQGAASIGAEVTSGGVAYGAHVGGFVAGAILIKLLPSRKVERRQPSSQQDRYGGNRRRW